MKHLIIALAFCGLTLAYGAEIEGANFPDSVTVGKEKLVLNSGKGPGLGLRVATMLKIKAYAAGLYLKKKSSSEQEILNSTDPKALRLHILYGVNKSTIQDNWQDSFERNCGKEENCQKLKAPFEELKKLATDVKPGDILYYEVLPTGIVVKSTLGGAKEKTDGEVKNKELARLFLSFFIGNPPNEELKKGLLGLE